MALDDELLQELKPRLLEVLAEYGTHSVERVKESLSTPHPPSSVPGEAPHRRLGLLQEGVTSEIQDRGNEILLLIRSNRAEGDPRVPEYLELDMQRPYMRTEENIIAEEVETFLAERL